jgi:dihydropteroate synthase
MDTTVVDMKANSTNSHEMAVISADYAAAVLTLITRSYVRQQQLVLEK